MPHQCTNCGHTFADGSKEMLSGCPECGGTKFQFHPDAAPSEPTDADPPDRDTGAVGRAASAVRDFVSTGETETDSGSQERTSPGVGADETEDPAQASARSDVVDAADLPPVEDRSVDDTETDDEPRAASDEPASREPPTDEPAPEEPVSREPVSEPPTGEAEPAETPDLAELREELNAQFESIKIVEPGQYELNLMELYDREEYIIALQENGRYVIEVADAWREDEDR